MTKYFPTLRFSDGDGANYPNWISAPLEEVAEIKKGEQINRSVLSDHFEFPVVNGGVTHSGYHHEFNTSGGTVTISEGGNSCGYVGWQDRLFWCGGHCYALTPKSDVIDASYLFYALKSMEVSIMKLRVGSGLPNIQKRDLIKVRVPLPSIDEQRKIADFLGRVDAKLEALRRKKSGLEAFKSGLMQRLFSQTLRFTRDDGTDFPDWEERELAEIGERSKGKNKDLEITRVLTNSAIQGIVDQGEYFDKDIANVESLSSYYIARFGDYVYNPRISVSAPVGPINRNNLADGVMSPLYTVFRINDGVSDFFAQYFTSNFWHDYMKSIANYGARHDRMAISMAGFMAMPVPWPHPDEQRKIADALAALDAKIAAVADQITHMETFKKGLLQQMFV